MDSLSYIAIIVACLLASAFFSGSEVALLRLRAHQLDADIESAHGPAVLAARDLIRSTSRLLVTILLGNNVANILGSAVAAALAIELLGVQTGILVATGVMTALVLVFSEILPKAIAAHSPRRVSYAVALPLYLLHQSLRPIHYIVDRAIEPVVKKRTSFGRGNRMPTSVTCVNRQKALNTTSSG